MSGDCASFCGGAGYAACLEPEPWGSSSIWSPLPLPFCLFCGQGGPLCTAGVVLAGPCLSVARVLPAGVLGADGG
eukprot:6656651-Pyramimonas_sp.AAC.1